MAESIELCILLPNIRSFITQFHEKTPYLVRLPPQPMGALFHTDIKRADNSTGKSPPIHFRLRSSSLRLRRSYAAQGDPTSRSFRRGVFCY